MSSVRREDIVPYTQKQMYDLVCDIEAYRHFLPWCSQSDILKREDNTVLAALGIRYKGISVSFTTLNRNAPDESITMELAEGPFRHLRGVWKFTPMGDKGCKVSLDFNYRFSNFFYEKLLNSMFERVVFSLITAFLSRARQIYHA